MIQLMALYKAAYAGLKSFVLSATARGSIKCLNIPEAMTIWDLPLDLRQIEQKAPSGIFIPLIISLVAAVKILSHILYRPMLRNDFNTYIPAVLF